MGLFVEGMSGRVSCLAKARGSFCLKRTCNLHTCCCFCLCQAFNNIPLRARPGIARNDVSVARLCGTHSAPRRALRFVGRSVGGSRTFFGRSSGGVSGRCR